MIFVVEVAPKGERWMYVLSITSRHFIAFNDSVWMIPGTYTED